MCGIAVGGAVAWRFVKYFFSSAVIFWVVAIILVVQIICTTYVKIATMENESALESLKAKFIIESKTLELTKKYESEQAKRNLEMQRIKTEQELEMRRLSKEQELEMRRLESKQKELDRKHRLKAYAEMERKISEFNAEFYQNIQEEKELPNEDTVKQKRNEIRRNVLVAYGLSEDPLSNLVKTNTPVVEYKIVVAPSTGWSIPIGGTQIVPTNLTLEDIFKCKVSKEYKNGGMEYKTVEEVSYQPPSPPPPAPKVIKLRTGNIDPYAPRGWRGLSKN